MKKQGGIVISVHGSTMLLVSITCAAFIPWRVIAIIGSLLFFALFLIDVKPLSRVFPDKTDEKIDGTLYLTNGEEPGLIALGLRITSDINEVMRKDTIKLEINNQMEDDNHEQN